MTKLPFQRVRTLPREYRVITVTPDNITDLADWINAHDKQQALVVRIPVDYPYLRIARVEHLDEEYVQDEIIDCGQVLAQDEDDLFFALEPYHPADFEVIE